MPRVAPLADIPWVLRRLQWMHEQRIWPNGLRYLWTDAFGVVLYASLYYALNDWKYIEQAEAVVADVNRVLGRQRGIRIGEEPDRDGQYFHYLAQWMYALAVLGDVKPEYRAAGVRLARDVHAAFVVRGTGVWWKMREDLSGPYPGFGLGGMDAYDGFVAYRALDPQALSAEIADMEEIITRTLPESHIDQDLGCGMMMWLAHLSPQASWAQTQTARCLRAIDQLWDARGFFVRYPWSRDRIAFSNYGVSLGMQAAGVYPERVAALNSHFDHFKSNDKYDREAITHVMACTSHFPGAFLANFPSCSVRGPRIAAALGAPDTQQQRQQPEQAPENVNREEAAAGGSAQRGKAKPSGTAPAAAESSAQLG